MNTTLKICTVGLRHGYIDLNLRSIAAELANKLNQIPGQPPMDLVYSQDPYHAQENPDGTYATFTWTPKRPHTPPAGQSTPASELGEPLDPATPPAP